MTAGLPSRMAWCTASSDVPRLGRQVAVATAQLHDFIEAWAEHVGTDVALVVEVALVRNLRAPGAVVHDDRDGGDVVHHGGGHFPHGHAETAVAHERHHRALRGGHFRPQPGGVRKADHATVQRGEQRWHGAVRQLVGGL